MKVPPQNHEKFPKGRPVRKRGKTAAGARAGPPTSIDIVPGAEECISYRIPAFRVGGRIVAGFSATAKGCSYFPFSGSTLRTLAADLSKYEGTKSALHFEPVQGLPTALVRKLLEARLAESPKPARARGER